MFSKKQTLIITVLALFVLATMAMAYGAWTDQLTIDGTATTGSLNVLFVNTSAVDNETGSMPDVGNCSITRVDNSDGVDHGVTISLTNAYPGYSCTLSGEIKNSGTIPVKLDGDPVFTPADLASQAAIDFEAPTFTEPTIGVIDPGASFSGGITIVTKDDAQEGDTFSGTIVLKFVQVNP